MAPRYPLARSEPSTATPSAPPATRVVSLIAEPTLILASGSEPMIASVAGAIAEPMPKPEQHQRAGDQAVAGVDVGTAEQRSERATIARPDGTTTRMPSRSVSLADSGPPSTRPAATGIVRRPASSAV